MTFGDPWKVGWLDGWPCTRTKACNLDGPVRVITRDEPGWIIGGRCSVCRGVNDCGYNESILLLLYFYNWAQVGKREL